MPSGKTHLHIVNCIISGNSAADGSSIYISEGSDTPKLTLSNSAYSGDFYYGYNALVTMEGTILTQAPQFVDPDGGDNIYGTEDDDLRLTGTTCINQCANATTPALPPTDLAGNARIQDGIVDMGVAVDSCIESDDRSLDLSSGDD